jgi:hypothetical protein
VLGDEILMQIPADKRPQRFQIRRSKHPFRPFFVIGHELAPDRW